MNLRVLITFQFFFLTYSFAGRKYTPPPIEEQFSRAEAVLLIQVMDKVENAAHSTLEVQKVYKGDKKLKGTKIKITGRVLTPEMVRRTSSYDKKPGPNYFPSAKTHYIIVLMKNWQIGGLPVCSKFLPFEKDVREALKGFELPEREKLIKMQQTAFRNDKSINNMLAAFRAMKDEKKP